MKAATYSVLTLRSIELRVLAKLYFFLCLWGLIDMIDERCRGQIVLVTVSEGLCISSPQRLGNLLSHCIIFLVHMNVGCEDGTMHVL